MPELDSAAYWDAQASAYAQGRSPSGVDATTLDAVPPRGQVLELGCGPGVVTAQLLERMGGPSDLVVTDVSGGFCAMAQALEPGLRVLHSDCRQLDLPADSLDTVYAMAVLHHLPEPDCRDVLGNIASWLRPGGQLALVEDWAFEPRTEAETRLMRLRRELGAHEGETHPSHQDWCERLAGAGLWVRQTLAPRRRESLDRYAVLDTDQARADLAWLQAHDGNCTIPMTLFCCEVP